MKRWISVALVAIISAVIYSNSLDGDFVFDDHRAILTNDDLDTAKTSVWELFMHDFWGGTMWRKESHKSYRPLTVLTYRYFNHSFTGLNPFSYHLVNVILHGLTCILFLYVAEVVLQTQSEWPLFAALLFSTHSIHVESVASVVGRAELVSAIFYFIGFLTYVNSVNETNLTKSWLKTTMSVVFAGCSMLSKEPGITVLGLYIGYDILKHWSQIWMRFKKQLNVIENESIMSSNKLFSNGKMNPVQISHMWKRIGILTVSGILLLWFRLSMNFGSEPIFKPEEMRAAFHPNRLTRILSFSNIYIWNIWLLLAPSPLCCDWSLGSLSLIEDTLDFRNIYSILFYLGLLILIIHTLMSNYDRIPVGLSMSFLVVPFLPSTGIIFRVGFVIAERVLFLSSSGTCLLVVIGARKLSHFFKNKKIVQGMLIFMILMMGIKTVSRNPDWKSDLALFESGARVNPNNVKMLNNYGMELKSANRIKESRQHYLEGNMGNIQLEGCQYWLDRREGQYIIPRAEHFHIMPDNSN